MKTGSRAWGFMVLIVFILSMLLLYASSPRHLVADLTYIASESEMVTENDNANDVQADTQQTINKTFITNGDFMRKQRNIQKRRKKILERGCYLSEDRITHLNMATDPRRNIVVDDKNQLLYCFVPKIACTSWKIVFLQLNGFIPPGKTPSQFYVNRHGLKKLRLLREYDIQQRRYILGHYKKFLFTRNPYTRLLSVYRNKLEPESTFERAKKWQDTVGKVITSKYSPKKASASTERNATLTFPKFVRYIVDDTSITDDNRHWRSVYDSCFPCDVRYDFIGRFETLHTDAAFILKLVGGEDTVEFPKAETSSPTNSSNVRLLKEYYSKVPRILMKKLYAKYRLDFHLFGYREM